MLGNILLSIVSICAIISYLPQVVKLLKTKKSDELSIGSWVLWVISSVACVLYAGLCNQDPMLIFQAALELFFCVLILALVLFYRKKPSHRRKK